MVDGQAAVVGAAAAGRQCGLEVEILDLVEGQHGGLLPAVPALAGDQGSAEGAHDAGDVGPGDLAAGDGLHAAQNGVVIEGAALDDDIFAKLGGIRHLDDLEEGIFDDGVGEAGGDVGDIRALLLGLLDAGIHKDGAAGPQVDGVLREQGRLGEILDGKIQGFGEGLDKGAAARGTGLVEQDIVDGVVLDADALHVLAADIQDAVYLGVEKGRGVVVGDGLDLALVQQEGRLEQGLAVAGRAAADDPGVRGQKAADLRHGGDGRQQGAAVIIAVEGIEQASVLADQGQLGGRGAGVDPQEAVSVVVRQVGAPDAGLLVAAAESVVVLLGGEKGIHAADLKFHVEPAGQAVRHLRQKDMVVLLCVHGAAHGGKEVGVFHIDRVLVIQLQGPDKGVFELGQKVQGAAQEGHMAPDGLAAGQTADGLVDDRLEDGGGQVLLGGALIDQGLNIGLGKDAAAGRDRVQGPVAAGILIEPRRVCLQEAGHLVDEGARAAGTDPVHALLDTAVFKIYDLGVLTAQFDRHIGLGRDPLQSRGDSHDLLDKRDLQVVGQSQAAGAGDHRMDRDVAQLLMGILHQAPQGPLDIRVVPAVIRELDLTGGIQDCDLDSGGSYINSQCIISRNQGRTPFRNDLC